MEDIVYKIRRLSDGMFYTGRAFSSFSKSGKIWRKKRHLTSHLNMLKEAGGKFPNNPYKDCEIVPFILKENEINTIPIEEYVTKRREVKAFRQEDVKKRKENAEREERRKMYLKLQKEFEGKDTLEDIYQTDIQNHLQHSEEN